MLVSNDKLTTFTKAGTEAMAQTRNAKYEQAQKDKGLVKVTLWLPEPVAPNFKLAASLCIDNPTLTLTGLRNLKTGRFVSIEKPVTGDAA